MLQYLILGPVEITRDAEAIEIQRPRQKAALAFLLLNANKVVSVSELREALWGGAEPETARAQIQCDISALRKAFKNKGLSIPLQTKGSGYLMNIGPGQLDIDVFKGHVASARNDYSNHNIEAAIRSISSGLGLWRGVPLSGLTASFVESTQSMLLEMQLDAQELYAGLNLMAGNYMTVVSAMLPLVIKYPLHEKLRTKLMVALFRCGRQADALWQARELRSQLVEQQGLNPSRSFIEVEEAILRGDSSVDAMIQLQSFQASPDPAQESIRLFPKPAQLPNKPPDFTGRLEYLRELDRLVFSSARAVGPATAIALVGPGGVGKTALAVHWAHQVKDQFPDGQLYINLRGYDTRRAVTSGEALSRMLRALGVTAEVIPSETEDAAGLFRSVLADRRILVVLDNAFSADQIRPLLAASQDVATLITSRSKLTGLAAREGVQRLLVKPLTPVESIELLDRLLGWERVHSDLRAANQLAVACNGLPLMFRIVAANIVNRGQQSCADVISDITSENSLDVLLVPGDSEVSAQSVFDQSYSNLSASARRCLRLLGHIPGRDFTLEAAAALIADDLLQTRRLIYQLQEASLIEEPVDGRYSMHDLLRTYARSRTEKEDEEADCAQAKDRLLGWYVRSANKATGLVFPHWTRLPIPHSVYNRHLVEYDSPAAAMAWLDTEYANLAAALSEVNDTPHAWLLADSLRGYFFVRRLINDWITAATVALISASKHGQVAAELASRLSLAQAYQWLGDHPQALQQYEAALRLAQRIGAKDVEIACHGNVGTILIEDGHIMRAIPRLHEAVGSGPGYVHNSSQLIAISAIGTAYQHLGQLTLAVAIHSRAIVAARSVKSMSAEGYALANLGSALHAIGEFEEAEICFRDALVLLRQMGDRDVESACLSDLAAIRLDMGDTVQARILAEDAWELAGTIESPHWVIPVTSMHATVRRDLDEHERAIRLAHAKSFPQFIARTLLAAARTAAEIDCRDAAESKARSALQIASKMSYRVIEGNALIVIGELDVLSERISAAESCARRALAIHKGTGHKPGEERARKLLDRITGATR